MNEILTAYPVEDAASVTVESALELQSRIDGQVFLPGEAGYHEARKAWNLTVDQHPAVIVVAATAADIAQAVQYTREQRLPIAIQGTGHGLKQPANGAMLVVTSRLKQLSIDVEAQTAWLGAGLEWGEVLDEAQAVGLAPLLGSSPNVGVVGYTLGGGFGWLGRKYGLSTDSVLTFELVSAEGELLRASQTENPGLFWALRGGGGGFGIITALQIRLYPVTLVYAGNLFYPVEMARDVIRRYREWVVNAPDELTSAFVLMNIPPLPELPEFMRGKSFVMVRGAYMGPLAEGQELLKYWREWRAPAIDMFGPLPFKEAAAISNDPLDPTAASVTGSYLSDLSDDVIETLIRYTVPQGGPPDFIFSEVRQFGGAIARVDPQAAAFSHRDSRFVFHSVSITPTPEAQERFAEVSRQLHRKLAHVKNGVYLNFLEGHESLERTREGYSPEAYRRLMAVKAKYDPDNVFRYSFDIPARAES